MSSEPDADSSTDGSSDAAAAGSANTDSSASGEYVHTPKATGDEREESGRKSASSGEELEADGFGRKGWALTAVLFMCVLVIPGIIYAYPYAAGTFGLTFFATYLALPLVPALLLGLVAVWSMTAATRDE